MTGIETEVQLNLYRHNIVKGVPRDELISSTRVWCYSTGVKRSEFYQAAQAGITVDATFSVWTHEYAGEQRLSWGNDEYDIIRTYPIDIGHTELVCRRRSGK